MTSRGLVGLLVIAVWGGTPLAAQEAPGVRAEQLLRDTIQDGEHGAKMLALERATSLRLPSLLDAARVAAASPDRVARSYALEILAALDAEGSRGRFVEALSAPHRSVRLRGLRALIALRDPTLVTHLVRMMIEDPDPDLRALAARTAGALSGEEVHAALRRALDDSHPVVQSAAVEALVVWGDLEVGHELLDRSEKATVFAETIRLVGLAGRVPDPRLVPRLAEKMNSAEPVLRVAAAASLLEVLTRTSVPSQAP